MRFQELQFGDMRHSTFAPGHAVLFRRGTLVSVGGYHARFRRVREDSEICERLKNAGWETYYVAKSRCTSVQDDGLRMLSRKALARSDWHSPADYSFPRVVIDQTRWLVMRLGHNLVKLRFYFWPVDVAVWAGAIGIAASQFLQPSEQTLEQEVRDLRCSGVLYRPNPSCLPLMKIRPPRCVPAR
jgi:cytochrome c biogenesis factor